VTTGALFVVSSVLEAGTPAHYKYMMKRLIDHPRHANRFGLAERAEQLNARPLPVTLPGRGPLPRRCGGSARPSGVLVVWGEGAIRLASSVAARAGLAEGNRSLRQRLRSWAILASALWGNQPMNEEQFAAIDTAVRNCEKTQKTPVFGARGGTAVDPAAFARLVAAATQALGRRPEPSPIDIKIATAMSWVYGEQRGPAPALAVFQELGSLIPRQKLPDDGRLVELVVAFGVGWQRNDEIRKQRSGPGIWNGAQYALLRLVAAHCQRVHRYGRGHWGRYPKDGHLSHLSFQDAQRIVAALTRPVLVKDLNNVETIRIGVPSLLSHDQVLQIDNNGFRIPPGACQVLELMKPEKLALTKSTGAATMAWPRGGRLVIQATECAVRVDSPTAPRTPKFFKLAREQQCESRGPADIEAWTCTCGMKNCIHLHRLCSWDPRVLSLSGFVERAVAGKSPWMTLKTNEFVGGMLAAVLISEGFEGDSTDHGKRLRVFEVEFRQCPTCKEKVWSFPGTRRCSEGHELPDWTPRKTEPLIGIDGDQRPWFQAEERCVCPNCETMYELTEQVLKEAMNLNNATRVGNRLTEEERNLIEQQWKQAREKAGHNPKNSDECDAHRWRVARTIDEWRQSVHLDRFIWCPQCRENPIYLPRQPTWVDVPVSGDILSLDTRKIGTDDDDRSKAEQSASLAQEKDAFDPTSLDEGGDEGNDWEYERDEGDGSTSQSPENLLGEAEDEPSCTD